MVHGVRHGQISVLDQSKFITVVPARGPGHIGEGQSKGLWDSDLREGLGLGRH